MTGYIWAEGTRVMKFHVRIMDLKENGILKNMKYYVIHYPKKPERKCLLIKQFKRRGISLDDVTWIEGLNKMIILPNGSN